MKSLKALAVSALCVGLSSSSFALEFNEVGHKAFGMGGVGVAVKNSPYGLFFNPALISAKPGTKIGYSLGMNLNTKGMFEILNYNLNSINDIPRFNELLNNNAINAKGQAAVALQLPEFGIGSFAIGYVHNLYASMSFTGQLPTGTQDIDNAQLGFTAAGFTLAEVPIAYAYTFNTPIGDLSAGVALKFMTSSFLRVNEKFDSSFTADKLMDSLSDILTSRNQSSSNFSLDLGLLYEPIKSLSIGIVGKNLTNPTFSFGDDKIKVRPQARLGIGYELTKHITIAADADLTNNDVLSFSDTKLQSQKIGTGLDVAFTFFDVRAGVAKDLRQDNGVILSAGLGFGILDIGVAASTSRGEFNGMKIPQYVALQIGGGFVF